MVAMVENNIDEINEHSVVLCKRCRRKLKDLESKRLGYGKICYAKTIAKNANFLFDIFEVSNETSR